MIEFVSNNDDNNDSLNESEVVLEPPEFSTLEFNGYSEAIEAFHKFSLSDHQKVPSGLHLYCQIPINVINILNNLFIK